MRRHKKKNVSVREGTYNYFHRAFESSGKL